MKRNAISLLCAAAIVVLTVARVAAQAGPSLTGTWKIEQTGANGTTDSQITLSQSGDSVVGKNAGNGNGFTGTYVSAEKINGKWNGPGGAGWITVYVSPNGHSFNGTWGYNGRAANGSFVGNKVLPPSPITAKGTWAIIGAGGPVMFVSPMKCTQSGPTVLCAAGAANIQGKFRATDKVRGTWTGPNGASGWVSFWFNGDNNSFNGIWGRGTDTSKAVGRMVGQRQL